MNPLLMLLPLLLTVSAPAQSRYPVYTGPDLGLRYSPASSAFRIWSPPAMVAQLLLYHTCNDSAAYKTIDMQKGPAGA